MKPEDGLNQTQEVTQSSLWISSLLGLVGASSVALGAIEIWTTGLPLVSSLLSSAPTHQELAARSLLITGIGVFVGAISYGIGKHPKAGQLSLISIPTWILGSSILHLVFSNYVTETVGYLITGILFCVAIISMLPPIYYGLTNGTTPSLFELDEFEWETNSKKIDNKDEKSLSEPPTPDISKFPDESGMEKLMSSEKEYMKLKTGEKTTSSKRKHTERDTQTTETLGFKPTVSHSPPEPMPTDSSDGESPPDQDTAPQTDPSLQDGNKSKASSQEAPETDESGAISAEDNGPRVSLPNTDHEGEMGEFRQKAVEAATRPVSVPSDPDNLVDQAAVENGESVDGKNEQSNPLRSAAVDDESIVEDQVNDGIISAIKSRFTDSASSGHDTWSDALSNHLEQFIAGLPIEWNKDYAKLGDVYARTYTISKWPYEVQSHFLYSLWSDSKMVYDANVHYQPYEREEAVARLTEIDNNLSDKANGEFSEYIPNVEAINETLEIIQNMKRQVENEGRRLYQMSLYVTVYASEEEHLKSIDRDVKSALEVSAGFNTTKTPNFPDLGLQSSAPLRMNSVAEKRENATQLVLDQSAATTFPFVKDTVLEQDGVMLGINTANDTAVILDIFDRNNGYNALVLGTIGSGKSFSEGQYIIRHRLVHPEDNIIIIDPMGGFVGMNEAIGGERIVVNGQNTINPLELSETPKEVLESTDFQANPYRMKLEDVRWFFERFFESRDTHLDADEWAVLERAIKKAYREKGIRPDPRTHGKESPTIRDVMEILSNIAENPGEQAMTTSDYEIDAWEAHASRLLMAMEPFREGNELDNLVGQTEFEINESIPTYIDMQQMDGRGETTGLMLKIVFSMLYEQAKETKKRTILAVDEAHKIIGSEDAADHWEEMFRHSRHHDLSIQLISQEFEDFFGTEDPTEDSANEAAKTMANQCTVRRIHRINNVDRRLAKDALDLTDDHIDYIEGAIAGEEGRGFTTALLDIEDIGRVGLKVEATQDELAVVDYDPEECFDDGNLTEPDSKQIRRALSAKESLTDPVPDADKDALLRELLADIPMGYLSANGAQVFVENLIDDEETPYSEEDREMLEDKFDVNGRVGQPHQEPVAHPSSVDEQQDSIASADGGEETPEETPTEEVSFVIRKEAHEEYLTNQDYSINLLREIASATENVDTGGGRDKLISQISLARARAEVERDGPTASIYPETPLLPSVDDVSQSE